MNEDFKKKLNPEQYRIMRQGGTEVAFSGKYWDTKDDGTYLCAACGNKLFLSKDKFDSGTGWPSFRKTAAEKNLEYRKSRKSTNAIAVRCAQCKSHIGEFLQEGTGGYYSVNSIGLDFIENSRPVVLEHVKGTLESVKDVQDQVVQNDGDNAGSLDAATGTVSTITALLSGGLVGVLIGGAAAFYICKLSCAAPVYIPVATSTPSLISTSTSHTPAATTTTSTRRTTPPAQTGGIVPTPTPQGASTSSGTSTTSTQ
jgi:peptide-methionine (R)-S-oxide reductase